jgi:nitroreductase
VRGILKATAATPGRRMTDSHPSSNTLREVVALASRAPSLFNVQPWRWQTGTGALDLFADPSRALPATDPTNREMIISNGAALHHAVLALKALGWRPRVRRFPDSLPDHLATIEAVAPEEPAETDLALAGAACVRQADRRQYAPRPVPPAVLEQLVRTGEQTGATILVAEGDQRQALAQAFMRAADLHGASTQYREELAEWTGLDSPTPSGIPESSTPPPGTQYGDLVLRDYGRITTTHTGTGTRRTAGSLLLISTLDDDTAAHLRAGEATSAVLCAAELEGLVSCPLSEALETDETRAAIRHLLLADTGHPQMVIRVGWPPATRRPPATPRRPVHELIRDLPDVRRHG